MAEAVVTRLDSAPAAAAWLAQRGVRALTADSRRVQPGDAFIAWPGLTHDGRQFVDAALAGGAGACLVEADGVERFAFADAGAVAALPDLKAAAGPVASAFLGEPSRHLEVVACTGTNGKTSTAWWTAQALTQLRWRCGVIGTLGAGEPPSPALPAGNVRSTGLTTPDPVTLQTALRGLLDAGCSACALEASSIGLAEQRLAGTHIGVAVYTNFTQDHLDVHGDMESYWQAKARLFAWPGLRAAVVNLDDARGAALAGSLNGGGLDLWTYSTQGAGARLRAEGIAYHAGGLGFDVFEAGHSAPVRTGLIGDYNVSNLLAVIGALRALGHGLNESAAACAVLTPVPGRMQRVDGGSGTAAGPEVVVDYAHTPDALEKALLALQPFARERGGQLVCVFGCGGNRDAGKRPLMGALAQRLAQRVVVTSDNPRHENPAAILAQIVAGAAEPGALVVIEDRRAAIAQAVAEADARDVILIAGKGHEDYQDIAGVKLPFSDAVEARQALAQRAEAPPMLTLADALALLPGAALIGDGAIAVRRVHSDTRTLQAGDLFVALRGERFDAHDFLPQARAAGAVAALAERGIAEAGLPGLQVADSQAALSALAAAWRRRMTLPLIAVAGSNGKTTVTQMIASILRAWLGPAAFATEGNFNNHIGVPLTLLRLRDDAALTHRAGVVELGMNHPGEIAQLAAIAAPTVALVNNAQREHQEFMASVEAVARENGAVIEALPADGTAVFPADDAHTPLWRGLAGSRAVSTFALDAHTDAPADVTADAQWTGSGWALALHTPQGDAGVQLQVAGRHNVKNALAAAACALAAGCPLDAVARGLASFTPVKGRSQVQTLQRDGRRVTLIDDSYNANPDSVRAAIDVLAGLPGPRWLVLGDMGEVGDQGPAFHAEVGAYAAQQGIEALWTAGPQSSHAALAFQGARHFDGVDSLIAAIGQAPVSHAVLVKGSRFMKMERVVAAWLASGTEAGAGSHDAA